MPARWKRKRHEWLSLGHLLYLFRQGCIRLKQSNLERCPKQIKAKRVSLLLDLYGFGVVHVFATHGCCCTYRVSTLKVGGSQSHEL